MKLSPTAVEEWAKSWPTPYPIRQMDYESMLSLTMLCIEPDAYNNMPECKEVYTEGFTVEHVLYNRLRAFVSENITYATCASIILIWPKMNLGTITMVAAYIAYKVHEMGITDLTPKDVSRIFPDGPLSESQMQELWQAQKIDKPTRGEQVIDNILDYPKAYESLRKPKLD